MTTYYVPIGGGVPITNSRVKNSFDDTSLSVPTEPTLFAGSAPHTTKINSMRKSELSASLAHTSTLEGYKAPPGNQYRNIKARYFQSLNVASPVQNRTIVAKPITEEPPPPAEPIAIKSLLTRQTTPTRTRRATYSPVSTLQTDFFGEQKSTEPLPIKRNSGGVRFKQEDADTESEDDISSYGSEDTFLFENSVKNQFGQYENVIEKNTRSNDDTGRSYTPFQPPHLMNQRSDFSLYREGQRRNIQKKVEKYV